MMMKNVKRLDMKALCILIISLSIKFSTQRELKPKKFRELYFHIIFKDTAENFNRLRCDKLNSTLQLISSSHIFQFTIECMKIWARTDAYLHDLQNVDTFYINNLHVYSQAFHRDDTGVQLGRMAYSQNFDIRANSKKVAEYTRNKYLYRVVTIFRCYGYAGYGCATEFPHSAKFKLNQASQKVECVARDDCGDDKCPNSFCNNNGNCYIRSYSFEKYCVCNPGVFGTKCTFEASVFKLAEEILLFSPLDELAHLVKPGVECMNCQTNECVFYENFEVCNKIAQSMTELGADKTSQEVCGKAICLLYKKDKKIYYMKSLGTQKPKTNAQDNNQKDQGNEDKVPDKKGAGAK